MFSPSLTGFWNPSPFTCKTPDPPSHFPLLYRYPMRLSIFFCFPLQNNVLSESLMHLPLRLIFCRRCLNFINVRAAYASKIQAPSTKNPLANSGTTRFREHITLQQYFHKNTAIFHLSPEISLFHSFQNQAIFLSIAVTPGIQTHTGSNPLPALLLCRPQSYREAC